MAIKINNTTVINDDRNIQNIGVATADAFKGSAQVGIATSSVYLGLTTQFNFVGSGITITPTYNAVAGITTLTFVAGASAGSGRSISDGNTSVVVTAGSPGNIIYTMDGSERFRMINNHFCIDTPSTIGQLNIAAGGGYPHIYLVEASNSSLSNGSINFHGTTTGFLGRINGSNENGFFNLSQIVRLTSNGSAIGPAKTSFFNKKIDVQGNTPHLLEAVLSFTKTTAGTVTITITTSQTANYGCAVLRYGAAAGGTATGASNQISLATITGTANAFGASASLTTGVNHVFTLNGLIQLSSGGTIQIDVTSSAGTVTPLAGSYFNVTQTPDAASTGAWATS